MMRILSLDQGERWIGVALSDPTGTIASPLRVLQSRGKEEDMRAIARLVAEHEVGMVLVGLPISLDGSIGPQAQRVQAFAETLAKELQVPVQLCDERLSTVAAERAMMEAGTRRERRREKRDAIAAAIFLQTYLDRMRGSPS